MSITLGLFRPIKWVYCLLYIASIWTLMSAYHSQVTRTVSHCFGILRQLRSIRRSLSHSVFQSLVAALVLTKLDLGNVTLAGIPSFQLDRLQAVMNAAARLVFQSSRHDHITPLLYSLHWLRAPDRIAYKLAVLVYQCVHGLAPAYLADALQPVAGLPGRQRLRSSSTSALDVPLTRLSMIGDWTFPVAASRTWNSLSPKWRLHSVCEHLRLKLKTRLFSASFQ